jgi:hypothetical protein
MGSTFRRFRVNNLNIRDEGITMTSQREGEMRDSWFVRKFWWLYALVIGFMLFGVLQLAYAQTPCTASSTTACFDASVKQGASPLATSLAWSAPGASSCTAGGGGAAWSGSVPTSGTRNLSGITIDMNLTLSCPIPGKATLTWTAPTTNTDGTAIANLAGYTVLYGVSPTTLVSTVQINSAGTTTHTVDNLAAGNWSFAVRARNAAGAESANSNVVSKAIAGSTFSSAVAIDVTQQPSPPTSLTVTEPTAMEIRPNSTGALVASRIGLVPLGTRCYDDKRTVSGVAYNGVPIELVDFVNWPTASVLREAWARCG